MKIQVVLLCCSILGMLAGCSSRLPEWQNTGQVPLTPSGPVMTESEARLAAIRYFNLNDESGCFLEDRGDFFFVAPPIVYSRTLEATGILLDKYTGEVYSRSPARPAK